MVRRGAGVPRSLPTIVFRPQTLVEALAYRRETGALPFMGGTDLMVRHRRYSGTPPRFEGPLLLLDRVEELQTIVSEVSAKGDRGAIIIGAGVSYSAALDHPDLPPLLREAIQLIAAPGIRNQGTVAGNICNASPAGDTLPPLYVHDAEIEVARLPGSGEQVEDGVAGGAVGVGDIRRRRLPISRFLPGPGKTALAEDEIVTAVHIPLLNGGIRYYRKVGTRKANALSKISAAGYAVIHDGRVRDFRFALGAVAPTVIRLTEIEAKISRRRVGRIPEIWEEIDTHHMVEEAIQPIDDQRSTAAYRTAVARNSLRVFLEMIAAQAKKSAKGKKKDD